MLKRRGETIHTDRLRAAAGAGINATVPGTLHACTVRPDTVTLSAVDVNSMRISPTFVYPVAS